jgi:VanZ family protein
MIKNLTFSQRFYLRSASLWTLFVVLLSLLSKRTIGKFITMDFFGMDKVGHVIFYALMVFLWGKYFAFNYGKRRSILWAMCLALPIGYLMEIFQQLFKNGRTFDLADMVANIAGATLGSLFLYFSIKR